MIRALILAAGVAALALPATAQTVSQPAGCTAGVACQAASLLTTGNIQIGGTTSSFPMLKPSGANLQVRLADDSGFGPLQAGNFQSAGSIALTAGGNLNWTGSTVLANPPGNGVLLWTKSAGGQPIVSTLPSCTLGNDGARSFVTDATVTTFASAVVGLGSIHVPVYCDGSGTPTWKIG